MPRAKKHPTVPLVQIQMEAWGTNLNPMPIAEAWDGKVWTVDLQYRNNRGIDTEATYAHPSLDTARLKAYAKLKNQIEVEAYRQ